jgi:iron complex outermembrane receptor protein
MPTSLNPGALTAAEYAKNRDSASATNIARRANKVLAQAQYSARVHGTGERLDWSAVAYLQRRFVDNPLATAPPGTTGATIGTLSTLNRWVTGARADATLRWAEARRLPQVTAGVDVQRSLDIRRNWRVTAGERRSATDTLFLDQTESVIAIGPFVSAQWAVTDAVSVHAGARADELRFDVGDRFLRDKVDNSASRTMRATTGHVGAAWVASRALSVYANVASAFETPTTTELSNRQDGAGGFNPTLGPQHITTTEAGVRGEVGPVSYTFSAFRIGYRDAIVQYLEANGRAYFRNAGETRNQGVEAGLSARLASWLDGSVAWTESYYRFTRYLAPRTATVTDTLDGKRVAGVPDRFVRLGARAHRGAWSLDLDHTWSGTMYGDDRNTLPVADWGKGALNARLAWTGDVGGVRVAPFAAVNNAFNVAYVGSVNVNGAAGRVLEPAPLRNFYVGVETGWRVAR